VSIFVIDESQPVEVSVHIHLLYSIQKVKWSCMLYHSSSRWRVWHNPWLASLKLKYCVHASAGSVLVKFEFSGVLELIL